MRNIENSHTERNLEENKVETSAATDTAKKINQKDLQIKDESSKNTTGENQIQSIVKNENKESKWANFTEINPKIVQWDNMEEVKHKVEEDKIKWEEKDNHNKEINLKSNIDKTQNK